MVQTQDSTRSRDIIDRDIGSDIDELMRQDVDFVFGEEETGTMVIDPEDDETYRQQNNKRT